MDLVHVYAQDEFKIWNNILKIPCRKRTVSGTTFTYFLTKEVEWYEVKAYWAYRCEHGIWNLYRVYNDTDTRRLAVSHNTQMDIGILVHQLQDKDITVHDCDAVDRAEHIVRGPRTTVTSNWSVLYDGKSILDILAEHPKMSFAEMSNVLENEGGYIDAAGIIHRGTAVDKVVKY